MMDKIIKGLMLMILVGSSGAVFSGDLSKGWTLFTIANMIGISIAILFGKYNFD